VTSLTASQSKQKKKELPAENGHIPDAPTPSGPCGTVTQEDVERWLADTNWTSTDLWSVRTGILESRKFIVRNIRISKNFESVAYLDSVTLSLIPVPPFKPYPRLVPEDAFKIAPTLNKGQAMFATKNIASGGMILVESPSLLCPITVPKPVQPLLFNRLDPHQRNALLALANNKPPEVCSKYEGIIRTNGIQVKLPVEEGQLDIHVGVFLNISRCNHRYDTRATFNLKTHTRIVFSSCQPNASWEWDLASWSMGLKAKHSIRSGVEITVAYINNNQPREARRKKLFKMYRFDCECERCHPLRG
jgi:hypothetical protein